MKKKLVFFSLCLFILNVVFFMAPAEVFTEDGFPFKGKINAHNVKLRAGYNENFTSLKNLKLGDDVIVLDRYFCWYQVKLPNDVSCYVSKKYISNNGFVTANQLNIRAGAGEKHHILGKLKKGEPVFIIASVGDWYRIRPPEGASGWIYEDYLDKISEIKTSDIPKPIILRNEAFNTKEMPDYGKLPTIKTDELDDYTTDKLKIIILAYGNFCNTYPKSEYKEDLAYKLNLLNLQLKNRQDQVASAIDNPNLLQESIDVTGTLRDLGRIYGTTATHKLKIKDRTKYYLNSSNIDLDDYIYKEVTIEGTIEDSSSKYPLINVRQIEVID